MTRPDPARPAANRVGTATDVHDIRLLTATGSIVLPVVPPRRTSEPPARRAG